MLRIGFVALVSAASLLCAGLCAADKYAGPRPPKPDLPYLLHGSQLTPTEVGQAREETRKDETVYVLPGPASPARTPLAEPIFILLSDKLSPEQMELYRMEVRNGNREVAISQKRHRSSRPLHVLVTRAGERLFRIDVDEPLENGEYVLSPNGSNQAFCFEIY